MAWRTLNVHFHCLVLDGVSVRDSRGALRFHELGAPTHEELTDVARWTHERLGRVLARHGRSLDMLEGDDEAADGLVHEQPVLASCYGASAADLQLLSDAPGQQTRKLAHAVRVVAEPKPNDAVAEVGGVNVHAGAAVPCRDRQRLERLCRYVARPPLAQDRLELTADGRCRYNFRHAWKNGVHAVVLAPLDLIARLCALIPPPRFHLLRYHGVLAAHANARAEVVPGRRLECVEPTQLPLSFVGEPTALEGLAKQPARHPWAWLLQRVFAVDVMTCPRCRGGMRLVKIANKPDEIARVLADLGLGARPPPRPRRAPVSQLELDFAA